jgi:large subunit ribosomal protein L23
MNSTTSLVRSLLRQKFAARPTRAFTTSASRFSTFQDSTDGSFQASSPEKPEVPKHELMAVAAAVARRSSTPIAVRLRRIKANRDQVQAPLLTASEEEAYGRLRNTTAENLGNPIEWAKSMHDRRSRIRGLQAVEPNDESAGVIDIGPGMGYGSGRVRIVGKRIYLPNFVITFVRNRTPTGKPYNPFEATFRIPKNLTKHDLRCYLFFVYGVKTTYIRTDNPVPSWKRIGRSSVKVRKSGSSYKRAVVGLVDPFYPPDMVEDMSKQERDSFKRKLWGDFGIDRAERISEAQMMMNVKPMTNMGDKRREYVPGLATSRAKIMKKVLEQRKERERLISEVAKKTKKDPIRIHV